MGKDETKVKMKFFKLKSEVKKHLGSALIAAFGLIAALAWKDVLAEYVDGVISLSPVQGKLITALIITFISITAIIIITKITDHKK